MEVLKWNGSLIEQPGIYSGVPLSAYHGAVTAKPSISSGGLRTIEGKSLRHFWSTSYLNPLRIPQETSEAMDVGSALHDLAAGESFWDKYAVRPEQWDSWRTKDTQAWKEAQIASGKTVLIPSDMEDLRGMAQSLAEHPTIKAGILRGLVEHSIFWEDRTTGIWLKARPDVIPLDSTILVDLKTCASADALSCRRSITDYQYHMQLALAQWGIQEVTGIEMTDFVLVFVERKPPYCVNIKPIWADDIEWGRRQVRRALDKFAKALETNEWPGYDDDEVPCGVSDFYRKRLQGDADAGIL